MSRSDNHRHTLHYVLQHIILYCHFTIPRTQKMSITLHDRTIKHVHIEPIFPQKVVALHPVDTRLARCIRTGPDTPTRGCKNLCCRRPRQKLSEARQTEHFWCSCMGDRCSKVYWHFNFDTNRSANLRRGSPFIGPGGCGI
jgi:hypothetical protein